ncbi:hypothetical protein H5T51_06350 [Candidatus Bathyarchaeota archaeon]|nr:hypothetical protein [Candidatus Bathyarchaeota archaeon]
MVKLHIAHIETERVCLPTVYTILYDRIAADEVTISAGQPRVPRVKMSRKDFADKNGEIVKYITEAIEPKTPMRNTLR